MSTAQATRIKTLQATIEKMKAKAMEWQSRYEVEAKASSELRGELDECSGMNTRLNSTLVKTRASVETIKDVARFFRAQRDRIDAYLSGTLDGVDREKEARYPKETYDASPMDRVRLGMDPPVPMDRRPNVQEPSAHSGDDGRSLIPYRDQEPSTDWENL